MQILSAQRANINIETCLPSIWRSVVLWSIIYGVSQDGEDTWKIALATHIIGTALGKSNHLINSICRLDCSPILSPPLFVGGGHHDTIK